VLGGAGVALLVAATALEGVPAVAVRLDPDAVEHLDQQGVVRRAVDRRVEALMALQLGRRRVGRQCFQARHRGLQSRDLGRRPTPSSQLRSQRFESATQFEQVACLRGVQRSDPRVPVRIELDESLLLQAAECLAEGGRAHADRLREGRLREDGARPEITGQDERPHADVGQVALPREGRRGGGTQVRELRQHCYSL
jgi:hypothetical protein